MQQITAMAEALISAPSDPEETAYQIVSTMGASLSVRLAPMRTQVTIKRNGAGNPRMTALAGDAGLLMATATAVSIGGAAVSVLVMATAETPGLARAAVTEMLLSVPAKSVTPTAVLWDRGRGQQTSHPLAETRPLPPLLPDRRYVNEVW